MYIFWEVLGTPSVWGLMALLFILSWVMQRIFNRLALMCQSVHVIHVPWGILWVTVLAHLFGFLSYKQVIILALAYLAAYPGMWWLNYKFTQQLAEILRQKHVTKETTGVIIWAEEIRWVWQVKRFWRRITGQNTLNEEVVNWILDNRGLNGYHVRHYYRPEIITRDD